jgi:AcrR family transcriptional regulator
MRLPGNVMSKQPNKTYLRIVQESLTLFNEQGERNISTNHIAAHLGMSPGNLYYHFRNKEEIVHQIFLQYREFITQHLVIPSHRSLKVDDLVDYFDVAFQAMWKFRFLFYDLPGLLARNSQMQAEYHQFINNDLREILTRNFIDFIRLGLLDMDESDIEPVGINIWLVVKFWFAFEQSANAKVTITEQSGARGVRQVLSLLKPYVQPEFMASFIAHQDRYPV